MESNKLALDRKLRRKLRPVSFTVAFALLLISASLSAADRPRGVLVRLEFERAPGARQCPGELALRREVAAELGAERFTETGPWRLHVGLDRKKNGAFVATADLFDSDDAFVAALGEVVSVDCSALVKGVALWAAVQLTDPPLPIPLPAVSIPATPPQPPQPSQPSLPANPSPASPLPALRPLPTAPPPLFRLRLGAATGADFGVGPTPSPLFSLNLALRSTTVPSVSFAFEVAADLPLMVTEERGARVHTRVLTGSLLTCVHALDEGMLYLCPMFTAGLRTSGIRLGTGEMMSAYSAAGGRLGVALPFASRRFAFTFAGDLLGTLRSYQLLLDSKTLLWRAGRVAGAVQAGVTRFF